MSVSMLLVLMQVAPAPDMAIGVRSDFQSRCLSVEDALFASKFADAAALAEKLPKRQFTLAWDDNQVDPNRRAVLAADRDSAILAWQAKVPGLSIKVSTQGDLNIRWERELADDGSGLPKAAEFDSTGSSLQVRLGFHRGHPGAPVTDEEAFTGTARAIGAYLGLADTPLPGSPMYESNYPHLRAFPPKSSEAQIVGLNLSLADRLRESAKQQIRLEPSRPAAELSATQLDFGSGPQGKPIPFVVKVKNAGTGKLTYQLLPDCSCFARMTPGSLLPGQSADIAGRINTDEYVGLQHKRLALISNDATHSVIEIPVSFRAVPAFRFYRPEGENVLMESGGKDTVAYVTLPPGSDISPTRVELDGIEGTASIAPWTGSLPDPEMGEAAMPRKGYKVTVHLSDTLPEGRYPGTLQVVTTSRTFPLLQYTLYAQKGIVALPDRVFLGDTSRPQSAVFTVSRPGKPFHILKVDSENPLLTAVVRPTKRPDEFEVVVDFSGKAARGDFFGVVRVHTDDPKQKTLDVAITGNAP